jgi:glycosyltransferase involved in cell wall biosynthesis
MTLPEEVMISLVVPTRNRAHTLRLVAPSYFTQDEVSEILFVDDAGEDDTVSVVEEIARRYPRVSCRLQRNETRQGASQSRNVGATLATNEFVLFCDDDEYLEASYAQICRDKLMAYNAGAVSGRRVYMLDGETPQQALLRFGNGMRQARPFNRTLCELTTGARFDGDIQLPITNSIILTRKALLERFPFDPYYAQGNGYREESDFQMNLFVNGYDIYITNECHSFHLPRAQVSTGGQHVTAASRVYWSVYYTKYFFDKYYDRYASREHLTTPKWVALPLFAGFAVYRVYLRPHLRRVALAWRGHALAD